MSVENLASQDAIKKMQEFVDDNATCFFCTNIADGRFDARPMSTQKVDDAGNIWFLSDKRTDKNKDIKADADVQLLYGKGPEAFMLVRGKASLSDDKSKIAELWNPIAKVWFPDGQDDPNVSVICVTPGDGYYWDTKHGSLVSFAKMMVGLATGKPMDDGIEGTMTV